MLQQDLSSKTAGGNPGLAHEEQAPAWPGFRPMRVANIHKESDSVTSFILKPIDGQPLPVFQAGLFVVLRLHLDPGKPPVLRSYSLSDLPAADHFRISVKSELNGIGSSFLSSHTRRRSTGRERAARKLHAAFRAVSSRSAERWSGRNARDVDAPRTRCRKIGTTDLVDLSNAQSRQPSVRR